MAMAMAMAVATGVVSASWSLSSKSKLHLHPSPTLFFTGSSPTPSLTLRISRNTNRTSRSRSRLMIQVQASKKQTFSSLDDLLQLADKPVLVDFYATWCGPCQFMAPVLNEVSITMADSIQVVKIDTEKYPQIADKYNIAALPTFILFKDGKPFDRFEGALPADQLIQRIQATLKLDT